MVALWHLEESSQHSSGRGSDAGDSSAPAIPRIRRQESAALLRYLLQQQNVSPVDSYVINELIPLVLALNDDEFVQEWIKRCRNSLLGDRRIILYLLDRDLVDLALELTPSPGSPTGKMRPNHNFDSKVESLVMKLRKFPSPRAFCLAMDLNLLPDGRNPDSPPESESSESLDERKKRMLIEYSARSAEFTRAERMAICLSLDMAKAGIISAQPQLDEFAGDEAALDFRKAILKDPSSSNLFIPAVCSLAHSGDLSGIERLIDILSTTDPKRMDSGWTEILVKSLPSCLIAHANQRDARLSPEASATYIESAGLVATLAGEPYYPIASYLVHLGAMDADTLAAALQKFGLETVRPNSRSFRSAIHSPQAIRIALMHPVSSESLVAAELGGTFVSHFPPTFPLGPLLKDPVLRAKIPPALFFRFIPSRATIPEEHVEGVQQYIFEHKEKFSPMHSSIAGSLVFDIPPP